MRRVARIALGVLLGVALGSLPFIHYGLGSRHGHAALRGGEEAHASHPH